MAEHQPANDMAYIYQLNLPFDYSYYGTAACFALYPSTGCSFVLLYGAIASHFSGKMSPVGSA